MRIEFDTENLSKVDYQILAILGGVATGPADEADEATKPATPARKRAAAKPKPAPEPELDEDDDDDDDDEDDEDVNTEEANDRPAPKKRAAAKPAPKADGDLRAKVTETVTDLVASGQAKKVKAALADLGVAKASELDEDQLQEFLDSLED